ncbi:MAG TPA: hypothetical protein VG710_06765, partial [Opitutus sp.]|nr:hypothetical protein [Opitutus sp.]
DGAQFRLPDRPWRQQAIAIGKAGEDWDFVRRFCDLCLPRLTTAEQWPERSELLADKAMALIKLDRAAEALALIEATGEQAGLELKIQQAAALLALKRADEAAKLAAGWEANAPAAERPAFLQLRAEALRWAGRYDEMGRALDDLIAMNPADPMLSVFAIEEYAKADRGAAAALDDYLFRFGGTAANLQLAAQKLAAVPDPPLVKRVLVAARERGYALRPFQVLQAMALLRAARSDELAELVAGLKSAFAQADPEGRLWFDWIRRLTNALVAPTASDTDQLRELLGARVLSLEAEQLTVNALRRAGRDALARDAVGIARRFYPNSPALRTQQSELQDRLAKAAATPRPAPAPRVAEPDREEFFHRLDAAIAAARWGDARREVDALRTLRPVPGWLAAHDAEILRRELRIDEMLGDRPALQLAARLLLNDGPNAAGAVLDFATALAAQGARDDALFLTKTVLEKLPGNEAAAKLLESLQPKKKAEAGNR